MNKIESVIKACNFANSFFKEIISNFRFKTEKELDRCIRGYARKNRLRLAFPPIIGSGKNAAEIHHKPNNAKLKGFTVIDYGFKVNGYCCDMTRTVFIGKPTKKQVELYNKVKKVQLASIKDVKEGIKYSELDMKSRKRFGKLKKFFVHALGHGVGKEVHQNPKISPKSNRFAKLKDVITIEPGVYFKGKEGIRIEDTVVVRKMMAEVLTKASKELIIIKNK